MATQALAFVLLKAFDRVWYAGLLPKLKSCGQILSGQIIDLCFFLTNKQL